MREGRQVIAWSDCIAAKFVNPWQNSFASVFKTQEKAHESTTAQCSAKKERKRQDGPEKVILSGQGGGRPRLDLVVHHHRNPGTRIPMLGLKIQAAS